MSQIKRTLHRLEVKGRSSVIGRQSLVSMVGLEAIGKLIVTEIRNRRSEVGKSFDKIWH